jgi:tetratricopeptide (TPR) repeat protein
MHSRKILIIALIAIIMLAIWQPWRSEEPFRLGLTPGDISPLVILPIETARLDEDWKWLGTALVDMFATKLNHAHPLRAVRLERLLEKVSPPSLRGGIKLSAEETIGFFQARTALTGRLSTLDEGFRLEIRLLDRKYLATLHQDHFDARTFQALFEAVDSLSFRLINALDWDTPPRLLAIERMTSGSLAAYHHYVMAMEDYIISDDSSLPRAADHLHLAAATDSTFARAYFLLAKVCDQAQALGIPMEPAEEPLVMANRFGDRLPDWERQYARGWQLWLVEGDLEKAVATLSDLSERHRDYAWQEGVPLILGRLLAHQGQWSQAIEQLKSYVQSEQTPALRRALGCGQLATAYQITGNLDGTIEAMERELSLFPGRSGNRYWWVQENMSLALLYFERRETEAVEELLTQAEQLVSNDARGLAMIGMTRYKMQQVNRAENLAQKALRREGDLALAHYLRGLISLQQKRYWRAVANFEAACNQEFNWDFLYHAALAHDKRGDQRSARELFDLLVEVLGGEDPLGVQPADQGVLGILLSRLDRRDEALEHGLAAIEHFPHPQAKYDLASIYAIQGDKAKAVQWLRLAFADGYLKRRQSRADFNLECLWFDPDFILLTLGE